MAQSPLSIHDNDALQSLATRADQLVTPRDYYTSGIGHYNGPLPENLICFARRNPLDLRRSGIRFHHHRWVVIVALKGGGRVFIDGKEIDVAPRDIVIIKPFQFHWYNDIDVDINWLFISFETSEEREWVHSQLIQGIDSFDIELIEKCLGSWKEEGQEHLCPLYLGLLLSRLQARPDVKGEGGGGGDAVTSKDTFLLGINNLISKRLQQPYCIKELGNALGMSESHLRARFRDATGMSIGKHMRDLRIRHACRLLLSSDASISEIADRCGFQNLFAFSRAFRSAVHCSPTEYRRQNLV